MDVRRTKEYQYMPFIVKEVEDKVGGLSVSLKDLRKDVDSVPPGAFIGEDENGLGHILKAAKVIEKVTATGTKIKVPKVHQIVVGDFVTTKDVEGAKAYDVTKIDTTNDEHDILTVGTALGVEIPADSSLVVVKAEDATGGASELPYPIVGITKREIDTTGTHAMVGVLLRGTVNVANMAFGAPKAFREALPLIRFED